MARNTKIRGNEQIFDATITEVQLNSSVAGVGLAGGAGTALSVSVGVGLDLSGDDVIVATDGITAAMLNVDTAGAGILQNVTSGALDIVGGSGITVNADDIEVTANGIKASHIDEADAYTYTGQFRVTTAPSVGNDVTNKTYVDGVAAGLAWKDFVRAASTGNVVLIGDSVIIDTITLVEGDRVLLKDQTLPVQNGIYVVGVVTTGTASFTRSTDADQNSEVPNNLAVFVSEGAINADQGYTITTDGDIIVDTTAIEFTQFTGLGQITAGDGMTKTGNVLDVKVTTTGGLISNVDDLEIKLDSVGAATLALGTNGIRVVADGITSLEIADNAVATSELATNAVTSVKIDANAVTEPKIFGGAVTVTKIGSNAVTTVKIIDDAVTLAKMATDSVDSDQYVNGSIDVDHINAAPGSDGQVLSKSGTGFTWISGTADAVKESDIVSSKQIATAAQTLMLTVSSGNPVLAASVQVFLNGLIQELGGTEDYTFNNTTGVATFIVSLTTGDIVHINAVLDN